MFAQCKQIAIKIAEVIPDAKVSYGMYTPPTPESSWDEGWQNGLGVKSFTHFWVESQGRILDYSCDQYGEEFKITDYSDRRYVKVGELLRPFDQDVLQPQVEYPKIQWNTLQGGDGGKVWVEWPNYERYLGTLG